MHGASTMQGLERLPTGCGPGISRRSKKCYVNDVSRGGPRSADHVDILGHMDVLKDILTIASGHGDELQDKILSDVKRIADNIKLDVGCD